MTQNPLYNVDSFTDMNTRLDPFFNINTHSLLNDSVVSSTGLYMVSVGGSGIDPNRDLISSVYVGMGSNTMGRDMLCLNCHTMGSDSVMPYGSIPHNAFTASSLVQTNCNSVVTSLVGIHPSFGTGSNQTEPHLTIESLDPVDQDPHLQPYNSGIVIGVPAPLPMNFGVVIGAPHHCLNRLKVFIHHCLNRLKVIFLNLELI